MSSLWTLRPYLIKYRWQLLLGIFFLLVANAVNLLGPYVLRLAVDSLRRGVHLEELARYAGFIVLVGAAQGVFAFGSRWQTHSASRYIAREMRNNLFSH